MSEEPVKYEINLKAKNEEAGDGTRQEKVVSRGLLPEAKQEKLISHSSILLDFKNYQEIYNELKAQVKLSRLPLNHVIFNFLSLGIMTAHEEERRRNGVHK